jgi:hypothetical protein
MTPEKKRPGRATRRFGYAVAVLVNLAILLVVNRWPGWEAVPFLTGDTEQVLGIVNASIIAGVVANVLYLAADPRWFKGVGDIVTTAIGLAATVRVWQVFPFDFGSGSAWDTVARVLLVIAMVGSVIGIVATTGRLVGSAVHGATDDGTHLTAAGRHR